MNNGFRKKKKRIHKASIETIIISHLPINTLKKTKKFKLRTVFYIFSILSFSSG